MIDAWLRLTILAALVVFCVAPRANAVTTFLHHFDVADANGHPGAADYALGNPSEQSNQGPPAEGPGGTIVPGGKFGNAVDRSTGGRLKYQTAGNYNVFKGTIEMWIKGPGVTAANGDFKSLWGTDTSSGGFDCRMYIYNDQTNDFLRSLGGYQRNLNGDPQHWEVERPIPLAMLDNTNWHHVVWEYDTTPGSEITQLWWDGKRLTKVLDPVNPEDFGYGMPDEYNSQPGVISPRTGFNNTRMHIGESQAGSAPWPGKLDEVRFSDHLVYDPNSDFTPPTAPFQAPVTALIGDYNSNGKVDAADYTVWRDNLGGSGSTLGANRDPANLGIVSVADYNSWKANFGMMAGSGAAALATVPEPGCIASSMVALIGIACVRHRHAMRLGKRNGKRLKRPV